MATLLLPSETAERLRTTERHLAQQRYLGTGPRYVKLGASVRYRDADVEAYIAEHLVEPRAGTNRGDGDAA